MCEVFGISRQALHKRATRQFETVLENEIILQLISPHRVDMPRIGTRKLYWLILPDMEAMNINMGRDKLFSLLREQKLLVRRKKNYTKTTNSMHRFRKYPNLIKDIKIGKPEEVWVSDITYIKTEQGFEYLSLITDFYSKRIVGYHLADNLKAEGPLKALQMAIASRKYPQRQLIHHSDKGFQYCSDDYTQTLINNNINISMTQAYDPYENAVAERVNGILKDEFDLADGFINHLHAVKEIKRSIETYNSKRPHISCNMLTPDRAHNSGTYILRKWKRKFKQKMVDSKLLLK